MRRDGSLEAALIVAIEGTDGLVEEPQRCRHHVQSGKSEAPPLAGGQPSAGPIRHLLQRERRQRRFECERRAADAATM
jgi:hypothetical protein